jgi:MoxR-like ATPase
VIIGQDEVIAEILTAFLAGGHCLLRGVPGLAKTLLIKTLAEAVHLKFNRIQFTPDLMPSDIIGTEVIEEDRATGTRHIRFMPGPIFANIILADEINRTPPKTQAALLEAMQEYQVTGRRGPASTRSVRCSCWRRKTRSSRKEPIRCPKRNSIASC